MTDYELLKFQHEHVAAHHVLDRSCDCCVLLEVLMRLRRENEELRELVDRMTAGLRHKG